MSYADLLKDPRWQKRRLEIMERDEWTCQTCGDTEATLTVHHKSYRMVDGKFADVWDYGGEDLITLCSVCHSEEEECLSDISKTIYHKIRGLCSDAGTIDTLIDFLATYRFKSGSRINVDDVVSLLKDQCVRGRI